MRLIDADKLMEEWNKQSSRGHYEFDQTIMEQPTAYDVEAVVAELEKYMKASEKDYALFQIRSALGEMRAFEKAIEIVRGKE